MRPAALCLLSAMFVLAMLWSPVARGAPTNEDRGTARALANEGLTLFKRGAYQDSIDKFQQAEALVHAPPHLLYIARAQAELGSLLAARETYGKVIGESLDPAAPRAFRGAQDEAKKELEALEARIPRITIEVVGAPRASTLVSVDDNATAATEVSLDPGEHTVVAEAGGQRRDSRITLAAGQHETVRLVFQSEVHEEEPTTTVPLEPVYVMAAGGAVLIAGVITGALALVRAGELNDLCPVNPCAPENEELADEANALATASTTLFVVGGVTTAVGLGWLIYGLTNSDDTEEAALEPVVAPGFLGLRGRFR